MNKFISLRKPDILLKNVKPKINILLNKDYGRKQYEKMV